MLKTTLNWYYQTVRKITHSLWSADALGKRVWYIKYGFSVFLLLLVTSFKLIYKDTIGSETPFLLYFAIVILATGFGGIGPGIFTTVISALACNYYFLEPVRQLYFNEGQVVQFTLYFFECLLLISLSGAVTRANKNLRRSGERFKAMIENSSDAILVGDQTGEISYASPAIEKVLGYSEMELKKMNAIEQIHPEDIEKLRQEFAGFPTAKGQSQTVIHRYRHKNQSWAWIESTVTNLLDHPAVNGVVANFRNVTDRMILEQQKDEFIGVATHELKTPVTSIKAYTQILYKRFQKDGNEASAKMVRKMDQQLNKLISLIGDMLDVTKIEAGLLQFQDGYYDFNSLVTEVAEELQRTTSNHTLELQLGETRNVLGDRQRMGQVLTNLISNAIKYSPHSSTIRIYSDNREDTMRLCVEDEGVGISIENQGKIFERFYRVSGPDNHTFPGVGLGLYISNEIMKRQGGRIIVESEQGQGSRFCIELPYNYNKTAPAAGNKS